MNEKYYYPIDETLARRAHEANSFREWREGAETAAYRQQIDKAVVIAEKQISIVDEEYHQRIYNLLDRYAKRYAELINKLNEIRGRVPSIMISGGSNFPVRAKEKQNAAMDKTFQEIKDVEKYLDKIRSLGTGGIKSDDPKAIEKLEAELKERKEYHEQMKAVNVYFRKNGTLEGCTVLEKKQIDQLMEYMDKGRYGVPYPQYAFTNHLAKIKRLEERITGINASKTLGTMNWEFEGGRVESNVEAMRLQIIFDGKPDETIRTALKKRGFRWSPSNSAWQRLLNSNAIYAAREIKELRPIPNES